MSGRPEGIGMGMRPSGYIPAAEHDWLLPLYNPGHRALFREEEIRRELLGQADIRPDHRVLDVGCGTGTFLVRIKAECPEAAVVGLDGDAKALAVARRKATQAGIDVALDNGLTYNLP